MAISLPTQPKTEISFFSKNYPSMMTSPFVWVPSTEFMCQDFFCAHLQEPAAWPEEKVSEFCGNSEVFLLMTLIFGQNTKELLWSLQHAQPPFFPHETIDWSPFLKYIDARPAQTFFPQTTRKVLWLGGILQVMMVAFFGAAATWPGRFTRLVPDLPAAKAMPKQIHFWRWWSFV